MRTIVPRAKADGAIDFAMRNKKIAKAVAHKILVATLFFLKIFLTLLYKEDLRRISGMSLKLIEDID
jgi:hypothetical protein